MAATSYEGAESKTDRQRTDSINSIPTLFRMPDLGNAELASLSTDSISQLKRPETKGIHQQAPIEAEIVPYATQSKTETRSDAPHRQEDELPLPMSEEQPDEQEDAKGSRWVNLVLTLAFVIGALGTTMFLMRGKPATTPAEDAVNLGQSPVELQQALEIPAISMGSETITPNKSLGAPSSEPLLSPEPTVSGPNFPETEIASNPPAVQKGSRFDNNPRIEAIQSKTRPRVAPPLTVPPAVGLNAQFPHKSNLKHRSNSTAIQSSNEFPTRDFGPPNVAAPSVPTSPARGPDRAGRNTPLVTPAPTTPPVGVRRPMPGAPQQSSIAPPVPGAGLRSSSFRSPDVQQPNSNYYQPNPHQQRGVPPTNQGTYRPHHNRATRTADYGNRNATSRPVAPQARGTLGSQYPQTDPQAYPPISSQGADPRLGLRPASNY